MRYITEHLAAEGNQPLSVVAMDSPVPGFATGRYDVVGFNTVYNPAASAANGQPAHFSRLPVIFESNPDRVDYQPADGISVEALLAIIADRLTGLQHTPQACLEYQVSLESTTNALHALTHRRQRVQTEETTLRNEFSNNNNNNTQAHYA